MSYQATTERKCVACSGDAHLLHTCSAFQAMTPEERSEQVRRHGLCLNCLRHGHFVSQCQSAQRCKTCHGKHHTMIHVGKMAMVNTPSQPSAASEPQGPPAQVKSHFANGRQRNILLMTCQVMVRGPSGHCVEARALLDSGSGRTDCMPVNRDVERC